MAGRQGRGPVWAEVAYTAAALGAMAWGLKIALQMLDPYREQREQAKRRAAFLKLHLGRTLELNEFEQLLALQVVNPDHIEVEMQDISGLEGIVADMENKVLFPLTRPELYKTTLWKPVKGVLLYGPPGTGKTMLAKALAKESKCFFLNITASAIMSKWLGDANRLVKAVFSLAAKLQPCIVFIDEVDAMLGKRGSSSEHEAMLQVKTEFMQLWDGMESSRGQRVVVMGATNRPWMVDEAVLRRFTLMYEIGLPNASQRKAILRGYLRKHNHEVANSVSQDLLNDIPDAGPGPSSTIGAAGVTPGAAPAGLAGAGLGPSAAKGAKAAVKAAAAKASGAGQGGASPSGRASALDEIAAQTEGFTGSDLLELCSQAAQQVLAEHLQAVRAAEDENREPPSAIRPLVLRDLQEALTHVRPSLHRADEYSRAVASLSNSSGTASHAVTPAELTELIAALLMKYRT